MNLQGLTVQERKDLTRSYPVLISSFPNMGKSSAVEFLPDEEKARTIIFLAEGKQLPEDRESQYRTIYRIKTDESQKNEGNVKYLPIEQYLPTMKKAIAHDEVDRIILDSFTAFTDTLERTLVKLHNGFTVWVEYSKELYDFFSTIKEETYVHGKFVYVLGHYVPAKDKKEKDSEQFTKVAGSKHYRMVESNFNTVLTLEDFKFKADNNEVFDSTRIKRSLSPFETKDNSLAELEEILTK